MYTFPTKSLRFSLWPRFNRKETTLHICLCLKVPQLPNLELVTVTNFPKFVLVQLTKSTHVSFCYFSYFNLINIPLSFPQTPCISFRGQSCHIYAERIEDIVRSWHAKRDSIMYITYVCERRIDFPLSQKIQKFQM